MALFLVTSSYAQAEKAAGHAACGHIDATGLKALMDANIPFVLFDARGNDWNDGTMIPGATLASYKFSTNALEELIPDAQHLIIVYCYSPTCPLSKYLTDKLAKMGYLNVIEYPGGLKEWRDVAKYPVVPIDP